LLDAAPSAEAARRGVAAVVATARAIDDGVATEFAVAFYRALAAGASVKAAFHVAEGAVITARGRNSHQLYANGSADDELADVAGFPWSLSIRPGAEAVERWNLPDQAGKPLLGLPEVRSLWLPPKPYRHLLWFTREYAEVFFGAGMRSVSSMISSPHRPAPQLSSTSDRPGSVSLLCLKPVCSRGSRPTVRSAAMSAAPGATEHLTCSRPSLGS